jgi:hypothetical protein
MLRRRLPEAQVLYELEESLTARLENMRDAVLRRVATIRGGRSPSVHSFHGVIGGKNNTFVDSIRTKFTDPQDFKARWLRGLMDQARPGLAKGNLNAAGSIVQLLKDETIREYTLLFLERNFYRNLEARTRDKPAESLWRLWFGDNKMTWGLIIAPAHRNDEWTNDVSEIRRAPYKYWTVGHVLETGLIDPASDEPIRFETPGDLMRFYRSVLKRVSNSQYEKAIADRYIQYLEESDDHEHEPFLIPELRYAGLEQEHLYRLDYSILNPHSAEYIGFEFSPHSKHGAIKGLKNKTQSTLNAELAAQWEKEMRKRNSYFSTFGITTVTFTGNDLQDMDQCFEEMKRLLSEREAEPLVLTDELEALDTLDLSQVTAD